MKNKLFLLSGLVMSVFSGNYAASVVEDVLTEEKEMIYVQTDQGLQKVDAEIIQEAKWKFFRAFSLLLRAGVAVETAITLAGLCVYAVIAPFGLPFYIVGGCCTTLFGILQYWIADYVKYGDTLFDSNVKYEQFEDASYFERKRKEFASDLSVFFS